MHGSWYLTGFLMEKPLAVLRDDLTALGLARRDSCGEPEDHLAALCDVMRALLIDVRRAPAERARAQEDSSTVICVPGPSPAAMRCRTPRTHGSTSRWAPSPAPS